MSALPKARSRSCIALVAHEDLRLSRFIVMLTCVFCSLLSASCLSSSCLFLFPTLPPFCSFPLVFYVPGFPFCPLQWLPSVLLMQKALVWLQFLEQLCRHRSLSLIPVFASEPVIERRGWKVMVCLHLAHLVSLVGSGI